jgi:hypothetical protein
MTIARKGKRGSLFSSKDVLSKLVISEAPKNMKLQIIIFIVGTGEARLIA